MLGSSHRLRLAGKWLLAAAAGACSAPGTPPRTAATVVVERPAGAADDGDEETLAAAACTPAPREPKAIRPVADVVAAPDDPLHGRFTLRQAIEGLSGSWPLRVEIRTDHGAIACELWDRVAPITVANFVGLSRGLRPFQEPGGGWVRRPAYDGLTFHRVVPGFIIQGGDPTGTGSGDAGYMIPDEIDDSIEPDHRGLLYMAHRGPNTGGMQFFILDGPAPHIKGGFTAFGECGPESVIRAIATSAERARMHEVRVRLSPGCG